MKSVIAVPVHTDGLPNESVHKDTMTAMANFLGVPAQDVQKAVTHGTVINGYFVDFDVPLEDE